MRLRSVLRAGIAASLALAGYVAVTSCGEPYEVTFGNPNTLDRKNVPGEGGVEALVCTGDASVGPFDGSNGCPSFANDIFPYFAPNGAWKCSSATCHAAGATAPVIDGTSAAACLESLRKISVQNRPYLPTDGGRDPNAAAIMCNLQGACGSKMPKPPGADPSPADLCKVEAWLKCGAPN